MRKDGPEITIETDAAYVANTILMRQADGTYTVADDTPANASRISVVQLSTTFTAGKTTGRLLSPHVTHELIAAAPITDCTVPLTVAAGGTVTPGGAGAQIAMPLHTAVAGQYVECEIRRTVDPA